MFDFLKLLFDTSDFMPRWNCGSWTALHGWTHVVSDLAIWGAYFALPVLLIFIALKRPDVPFPRLFWLFGAFILACGTGHLVEATIFWEPWYRLSAAVKLATAVVSWATVVTVIPILPKALAFPALAKINSDLERQIQERHRAEERFQLAVEAAPNAMVMVDASGKIVLVNAQTEQLFGYPRDELLGRSVELLVPPAFRDSHPAFRRAFFRSAHARAMGVGRDLYGVRKDGTEVPVEIGLNPIVAGGETFVLSAIVDITERKGAQDELVRANARLSKANQEMEQFVYTVSHDLKSPLITMEGFAGRMRLDAAAGRVDRLIEFASRIQSGVEKMRNTIDALLEVSRVGRGTGDAEDVSVGRLVRDWVEEHREQVAQKKLRINVESDLPTVRADRLGMLQIFDNLLSNALKYGAAAADPAVAIGARRVGGEVRFFVQDNGSGIEPAYHDKVFELFERLHKDDDGTGVGLSLVRKAAEAHGGRAWVESELGKGATFWVALPAGRIVPG